MNQERRNGFQIETIYALKKGKFNPTIEGKKELDSDIVIRKGIEKIGIEIKCYKESHAGNFILNAMKQHKKAQYYLFLTEKNERINQYLAKAREANFIPMIKDIHCNWILILGKNPLYDN